MNPKEKKSIRHARPAKIVARAAVVAALYAALCLAVQPLTYGPIQIRFAEALTVLPCLMAEAIPGLAIGCFIVNIFSPFGWYDMVFGTLITLVAAVLTRLMKKAPPFATLSPILLNAFILPLMWLLMGESGLYWLNVGTVMAGQAIAVIGLGLPLYYLLRPFKRIYT